MNPVFDPTGEFPGSVDQTALDAAANAIAAMTLGTTMRNGMSTALTYTGARVEVRDDSTDALIAISIQQRLPAIAGLTTPLRGAQSACVISLRTNTPGGSGRGRIYWPQVGNAVDTTLRLPSATVTSTLTDMVTFLHGIEDILATNFPTIGFDLAVRSRQTHTTPHVNKLQVGNVIDTQRRRRDKMVEDYQSASF